MSANIIINGHIDNEHRLTLVVPDSFPSGPVTVTIAAAQEDEVGTQWAMGVAQQWREELSDTEQDIYSLADGEPVDPA